LFDDEFVFLSDNVTENIYSLGSPAIKAYLWLLIHQEGEARQNRFELDVSDADLARALSVARSTAGIYRKELQDNSLIDVETHNIGKKREIRIKNVKY
jgi:Mn-dependent DtxR family transcriptional regulator